MGDSLSRLAVQFEHFEQQKKLRIAMIFCFVTIALFLLAEFGPDHHVRGLGSVRYIGYVLAVPTIFCTWSFVKTRDRSPNQDVNQATVNSEQQYPPPSGPTDVPPPTSLPTGPQPSYYDNRGTLNNTLPYRDQGVAPYLPPPLNTIGSMVAGQPPLPYPEQQGTEPHLPPPPLYDQAMQASQQS